MSGFTKFCLLTLLTLASCTPPPADPFSRPRIDLRGEWQFALDSANTGIEQQWFGKELPDAIQLPGTTDAQEKGPLNRDTSTLHLNRPYPYEGPAWYRRKVIIPQDFQDQHLTLHLERTKPTTIWIDDHLVGNSRLLQSPQRFAVAEFLTPGEHYLTIRVDNDLRLTPYGNVHIYTDETQTNWNGILGEMYIEAAPPTHITNLQVYPDIDEQKIGIQLELENQLQLDSIEVELRVKRTYNGQTDLLPVQKRHLACQEAIKLEYELGEYSQLWDEYEQPLYELTVVISQDQLRDVQTVPFGMREFTVAGTQFAINGRNTFLRGKHDAAVFPRTGYTPTEVEDWVRIYRIAKAWGINHYRFHSYCPPEAAFTAADREGIYLQAELPFWGGLESDTVAQALREEGLAMLKAYANHPSLVLFSHGNELWSGHEHAEANILALRAYDDRPLYTMGSNNSIGYIPPTKGTEFFVGARTPADGDTTLTHTRLTHGYVDSREGGILNTHYPGTEIDFSYPVSQLDMPIISHEIGQYQVYPDYREIEKYTGVLQPWNLEIFRKRLEQAGMLDQNQTFQRASGAWSAICYKEEMEAALRTPGFGGFQLLDLQDFPGQGTALVGMLDAFMDEKGIVDREVWLQSCKDLVLLLRFPKYVWTNQETYRATVEVANYSQQPVQEDLAWEIRDADGQVVETGIFPATKAKQGSVSSLGEIRVDLSQVKNAQKLMIYLELAGTSYTNQYPLWVYPPAGEVGPATGIEVVTTLSAPALDRLENGAKLLLFPKTETVADNSVPGLFPPEFWNYEMFKGISEWAGKPVAPGTLGILTDPKHPIFSRFPTDFHTNWHWFSMIKASNSFVLDETPADYRPIVQVIDNLQRNHKLGLIFEFRLGRGKLLVCMVRLNDLPDKPEAAQLYRSILTYMDSAAFNPEQAIARAQLQAWFGE